MSSGKYLLQVHQEIYLMENSYSMKKGREGARKELDKNR